MSYRPGYTLWKGKQLIGNYKPQAVVEEYDRRELAGEIELSVRDPEGLASDLHFLRQAIATSKFES